MKSVTMILVLALLGLSACEEKKGPLSINGVSMEQWEYSIDGKAVGAEDFKKKFDALKEVPGTWFCAETKNGGVTGYDMKDKSGNVYEFRAVSEPGSNRSVLVKKPE